MRLRKKQQPTHETPHESKTGKFQINALNVTLIQNVLGKTYTEVPTNITERVQLTGLHWAGLQTPRATTRKFAADHARAVARLSVGLVIPSYPRTPCP